MEVEKIIEICANRAEKLIEENRENIIKLSNALLEKETLDVLQVIEILGDRPYSYPENILNYINEIKEYDNVRKEKKKEEEAKIKDDNSNNKQDGQKENTNPTTAYTSTNNTNNFMNMIKFYVKYYTFMFKVVRRNFLMKIKTEKKI